MPGERVAGIGEEGIRWNYTTWLNLAHLGLALAMVVRFLRAGGRETLSMRGGPPDGSGEEA